MKYLKNTMGYADVVIEHVKDKWRKYLKYISFGLLVLSYAYIVYWIDSLESVSLVISWFPDVVI